MTKPKGFYPGWTGKTRCGRECGVYATDGGGPQPIHGWVINPSYGKHCAVRYADGSSSKYNPDDLDFILEPSPPETREVWVNEYPVKNLTTHASKEDADICAYRDRIGPARKAILTFVEDEG